MEETLFEKKLEEATHDPCYQAVMCDGTLVSLLGGDVKPHIEEVAWQLAGISRFNGSGGRYSVAQHSCLVCDLLPQKFAYQGLMHDGLEAVTGDVVTYIKNSLDFLGNGVWTEFEGRLWSKFRYHFNLPQAMHPEVKQADRKAMRIEIGFLHGNLAKSSFMRLGIEPLYVPNAISHIWDQDEAFCKFMDYYKMYSPGVITSANH